MELLDPIMNLLDLLDLIGPLGLLNGMNPIDPLDLFVYSEGSHGYVGTGSFFMDGSMDPCNSTDPWDPSDPTDLNEQIQRIHMGFVESNRSIGLMDPTDLRDS